MRINYDNLEAIIERVLKRMREYQLLCNQHLESHPRCILRAPGGTGKTVLALTNAFRRRPQKILIVCSKNALYTWRKEIQQWFPEFYHPSAYTVIAGSHFSAAQRRQRWSLDSFLYVTTAKTLNADLELVLRTKWDVIIADEWHKWGLRNRTTAAAESFRQLSHTPSIIPVSGSGVRLGPQDLYCWLNIMDRKKFNSYWAFVHTYCNVVQGMFGKEIGPIKNMERFSKDTFEHFYFIPKSVTESQVPKLTRIIVPIDPTKIQVSAFKKLDDDMWIDINGAITATATTLGKVMKLRQLTCCPRILGLDDDGAAIEMILDKIQEQEPAHGVIFTPFLDSIPHFKAYIEKHSDIKVWTLQGGADEAEIERVTTEFRTKKGIVICSIMFAQSFEFESADNCHFPAFEWNQDDNEQCEWRLQRLTADITKPISAYYYAHNGTYDEKILEVLNTNTRNVNTMLKSLQGIRALLKKE